MLDEKPRSRGGAGASANGGGSGRCGGGGLGGGGGQSGAPGGGGGLGAGAAGGRGGGRSGRAGGARDALRDARAQPPPVDEEQESYRDANVEPIAGLSLHDYLIGRAALPSMPSDGRRASRGGGGGRPSTSQGGRRPNTTQDARGNRRLGLGRLNPSERDFAAPHRHAMPMGL